MSTTMSTRPTVRDLADAVWCSVQLHGIEPAAADATTRTWLSASNAGDVVLVGDPVLEADGTVALIVALRGTSFTRRGERLDGTTTDGVSVVVHALAPAAAYPIDAVPPLS